MTFLRVVGVICSSAGEVCDLVLGSSGVHDLVVDDRRDLHPYVVARYKPPGLDAMTCSLRSVLGNIRSTTGTTKVNRSRRYGGQRPRRAQLWPPLLWE